MNIVTVIYLLLIAVGFYFGKWLGAAGLVLIYFFFFHQRHLARAKLQKKHTRQQNNQVTRELGWAYRELGIAQSADMTTVKSARKKLLNHYHPDKLGQATAAEKRAAEEKVNQINRAYEAIKQVKGFHETTKK